MGSPRAPLCAACGSLRDLLVKAQRFRGPFTGLPTWGSPFEPGLVLQVLPVPSASEVGGVFVGTIVIEVRAVWAVPQREIGEAEVAFLLALPCWSGSASWDWKPAVAEAAERSEPANRPGRVMPVEVLYPGGTSRRNRGD